MSGVLDPLSMFTINPNHHERIVARTRSTCRTQTRFLSCFFLRSFYFFSNISISVFIILATLPIAQVWRNGWILSKWGKMRNDFLISISVTSERIISRGKFFVVWGLKSFYNSSYFFFHCKDYCFLEPLTIDFHREDDSQNLRIERW